MPQICYVMTLLAAFVRLNAIGILYMVFLGILVSQRRTTLAHYWGLVMAIYAALVIAQCASALGLPPGWWGLVSTISYPQVVSV